MESTPVIKGEPQKSVSSSSSSSSTSDNKIGVRVRDSAGAETFFKMNPNTPMSKMIASYLGVKGLAKGSVRFLLDGMRVNEADTLEKLGITDECHIDALLEQTGGLAF